MMSPSWTTYSLPSMRRTPAASGGRPTAVVDEGRLGQDFGANEAALEVGVDDAGSLGRGGAGPDGPGPDLFFVHGEEADEA